VSVVRSRETPRRGGKHRRNRHVQRNQQRRWTVIGRTIARLLNAGFPLRAALSIAKRRRLVGNQYVAVGDGSVQVVQSESAPLVFVVESLGGSEYELRIRTYPTNRHSIGSFIVPFIEDERTTYLLGGDLPTFTVSSEELQRYLGMEETAVVYDHNLYWSSDVDVERDFS
jgi:hypothetical protein